MGDNGAITLKTKVDTSGVDRGLTDIKNKTKTATQETKKYGDAAERAGKRATAAFKKTSLAIKAATATMVAGTVKIIKSSLDAYAEYEQLVGGVEKIFDKANISRIMQDANNAYKELGMSANQYLAIINDVGASFAATMGDQKGYDAARKGLMSISDYASGTGKSFEELSQKLAMITRSTASYQSIADQFSGILPATSADFLAQAQAAGFLSKQYKKLTDVPISEYQKAVTEMLELGVKSLNLAGNTAKEASTTISGSMNMMKAAWKDLLSSMGDTNGEIGQASQKFVQTFEIAFENLIPKIKIIMKNLGNAIKEVAPIVLEELTRLIIESLPSLLEAVGQMTLAALLGILRGVKNLFVNENKVAQSVIESVQDIQKEISAIVSIGKEFDKDATKVEDAFGGAADGVDQTNDAVKELKKSLLGFDELNILNSFISETNGSYSNAESPLQGSNTSINDLTGIGGETGGTNWLYASLGGAVIFRKQLAKLFKKLFGKGGGNGPGDDIDDLGKKAEEATPKVEGAKDAVEEFTKKAEGAKVPVQEYGESYEYIPAEIPNHAPIIDAEKDAAVRGAEAMKNYGEVFPYASSLLTVWLLPALEKLKGKSNEAGESAFKIGSKIIEGLTLGKFAWDSIGEKLFGGWRDKLQDIKEKATEALEVLIPFFSFGKKGTSPQLEYKNLFPMGEPVISREPVEVPVVTPEADARMRALKNLVGMGAGAPATDFQPSGFFAEQVDQLVGVVKTFVGDMFGAAVEDVKAVGNFSGELFGELVDAGKQMGKEVGGGLISDLIWVANKINDIVPENIEDAGALFTSLIAIAAQGYGLPMSVPMPAFARGAVIPPNRSFIGVLGDQKYGTNLEAPESLIRKIVREETQGNMGADSISVDVNFTGTEAALLRYLSPKVAVTNMRRGKNIITGGQA